MHIDQSELSSNSVVKHNLLNNDKMHSRNTYEQMNTLLPNKEIQHHSLKRALGLKDHLYFSNGYQFNNRQNGFHSKIGCLGVAIVNIKHYTFIHFLSVDAIFFLSAKIFTV